MYFLLAAYHCYVGLLTGEHKWDGYSTQNTLWVFSVENPSWPLENLGAPHWHGKINSGTHFSYRKANPPTLVLICWSLLMTAHQHQPMVFGIWFSNFSPPPFAPRGTSLHPFPPFAVAPPSISLKILESSKTTQANWEHSCLIVPSVRQPNLGWGH